MRRQMAVLALVVTVFAVGCGGGGANNARSTGGASGRDPVLEKAGVGSLELSGPAETGAGKIPTFSWNPVAGASQYRLFVRNASRQSIWAWQGTDTQVVLGGIPNRPTGEAGPVITAGSTWSVAALDAEGKVLAVSADRTVSP